MAGGIIAMALLLLTIRAGAVPVEEWNRTYPDIVTISDIAQTGDGGYIIAALKNSPDSGLSGYYLIKTDASGSEQWNTRFESDISICCIETTADGGYVLAGSKSFTDDHHVEDVVFVVKTDSRGNTEWMRTFENSSQPSVIQTNGRSYVISISGAYNQVPDSRLIMLDAWGNNLWNMTYQRMTNVHIELTAERGFLITSEIKTPTTGVDALIIKTDANGNELWNRTFGGTGDDGFTSIHKTRDGGYILAGYIGADHSADLLFFYMGDAWLVKIDADGNKQWDMTFGELEMKNINSVSQTDDGGYILAGRSGRRPEGSWVVKLTNDSARPDNPPFRREENEFSQIWTKTYNTGDEIYAVKQTGDGSIVLAGANFKNYSAFLMKTDSSGKELWNKTFKGERPYANKFSAVDETIDGGYILGGTAVHNVYGVYEAWLVKTDPSGNEVWNITIGNEDANEDISAVLAMDDGYVAAANIVWNGYQENPEETWFIRTDLKGNQLWINKFKGAIRDMQRVKEGGYILIASEFGGWGYDGNETPPTGWIIRMDVSGNQMWNKDFGEYPGKIVTPNSVLQTKDGGYIVAGDYSDNIDHILDAWVMKLDRYGNETWQRTIKSKTGGIDQKFHSLVETMEGDYIIGGKVNMYRTTGMDALLIKIDTNGNELWNLTAGGNGNQVVNSMQQTKDGGLILAGSMRNMDTEGHWGALLMKVRKLEENTNHLNESLSLTKNMAQKTAPCSGFYIAVLSFMVLFLFKRINRLRRQ